MWTLYEMLGLPEDRRDDAAHYADGMVAWADPDVAAGREVRRMLADSLVGLLGIGIGLAEERRAKPENDLMTSLVQAGVDGAPVDRRRNRALFMLLSVADNHTPAHHDLHHPGSAAVPKQKALLQNDLDRHIKTAMEERVRWTTPVMTFRRTTTRTANWAVDAFVKATG